MGDDLMRTTMGITMLVFFRCFAPVQLYTNVPKVAFMFWQGACPVVSGNRRRNLDMSNFHFRL